MDKQPCTKFCGVLTSFNKVMKLQNLNWMQMTSQLQMHKTSHLWFSFHISVTNFMENEHSMKSDGVFDQTYKDFFFDK